MSKVKGHRSKVFVGLSGGVDSSVSAALLKKAATPKDFEKIFGRPSPEGFRGYEVTGVFIHVWNPNHPFVPSLEKEGRPNHPPFSSPPFQGGAGGGDCQAADDRLDAMRVCAKLGIPFVELDLEKEYKKEVVDYMIREYKAGKTPNPDVFCNRFIKFGGFYEWAIKNGADFVATGHYARIGMREAPNHKHQITNKSQITNLKLNAKRYTLNAGVDTNKDQSYFLWQIRKEQLPHILFPVGGMKKSEVRALAKKFGLVTAEKKDSQGLCFVGKVDMKEFLSHYIKPKRGDILLAVDERGYRRGLTQMRETVIGEHDGAFFYTLGERVATNCRHQMSTSCGHLMSTEANYVVAKNIKENTLTVSHKDLSGDLPLSRTEVAITNCNWLVEPQIGKAYGARVRYRQPIQTCHLAITSGRLLLLNAVRVTFERPQTVPPGQSFVLYDGDLVVGGGVIAD